MRDNSVIEIETAGDSFLMLVLIVDRNKTRKIVGCMSDHGVFSTFTMLARGTADSEILNLLGLGDSKKEIVLSTLRNSSAKSLLQKLTDDCGLEKPGQGIAFTVPLTGVLYGRNFTSLGDFSEVRGKEGVEMKENDRKYELILAVTNSGYTDMVLSAAKSVHSVGGTIVKGRETGLKDGGKFFGVSIQPEKEIVIMLVPQKHSNSIMNAIMDQAGPRSIAETFAVTLPVQDTAGLSPEF